MKTQRIKIDGSRGEGGGQILRTALALSMVTGRSFSIERIRARRKKPGLMRQHLTAVRAAIEICNPKVQGAELGSERLVFDPGPVNAGSYHFAVGSAGSATLVLQAVLPALINTKGSSKITVEGGTHNPMAPPYHFLAEAFLPLVSKMGPEIAATLSRYGFYPAGGGSMTVEITGCKELSPLELVTGGEIVERQARALVAELPRHIAKRELKVVGDKLGWSESQLHLEQVPDSRGPGNVLMLKLVRPEVTELFTGFGETGVRAEKVASRAINEVRRHLVADVPVGPYLADQLLIPLSLARHGLIRTHALTRHARTNIEIIHQFLDVKINIEEISEREAVIRVES